MIDGFFPVNFELKVLIVRCEIVQTLFWSSFNKNENHFVCGLHV